MSFGGCGLGVQCAVGAMCREPTDHYSQVSLVLLSSTESDNISKINFRACPKCVVGVCMGKNLFHKIFLQGKGNWVGHNICPAKIFSCMVCIYTCMYMYLYC